MKQLYLTAILLVASVANALSLENEDTAYGELGERIVERIRLWPGLAPHETESSPGRYAQREGLAEPHSRLARQHGILRKSAT